MNGFAHAKILHTLITIKSIYKHVTITVTISNGQTPKHFLSYVNIMSICSAILLLLTGINSSGIFPVFNQMYCTYNNYDP